MFIARFNIDFAWTSDITLRAGKATCIRSGNVAQGIFGPRNEHREGNSQNTSAEDTTPSGKVYRCML